MQNIDATQLSVTWFSDKDGESNLTSQPSSSGEFFSTNSLSANDHIIAIEVTG